MRTTSGAPTVMPPAQRAARGAIGEANQYSPRRFFWEVGLLLAVCLALGLLVQALLA